jgi:hypothetical protein
MPMASTLNVAFISLASDPTFCNRVAVEGDVTRQIVGIEVLSLKIASY